MGVKDPSNKVISLTHRRDQKNGTSGIRNKTKRITKTLANQATTELIFMR